MMLYPSYKWEYFEVAVQNLELIQKPLLSSTISIQGLKQMKYRSMSSIARRDGKPQLDIPLPPDTPLGTWQAQRHRTLVSNLTLD
jgi:hypothetical protein